MSIRILIIIHYKVYYCVLSYLIPYYFTRRPPKGHRRPADGPPPQQLQDRLAPRRAPGGEKSLTIPRRKSLTVEGNPLS